MTRTSSQLAKTGVRKPPVYFCRQCIAVRVFEEGVVCSTCVSRACADDDAHSHLLRASDAANRREIRNEMIDTNKNNKGDLI